MIAQFILGMFGAKFTWPGVPWTMQVVEAHACPVLDSGGMSCLQGQLPRVNPLRLKSFEDFLPPPFAHKVEFRSLNAFCPLDLGRVERNGITRTEHVAN